MMIMMVMIMMMMMTMMIMMVMMMMIMMMMLMIMMIPSIICQTYSKAMAPAMDKSVITHLSKEKQNKKFRSCFEIKFLIISHRL